VNVLVLGRWRQRQSWNRGQQQRWPAPGSPVPPRRPKRRVCWRWPW